MPTFSLDVERETAAGRNMHQVYSWLADTPEDALDSFHKTFANDDDTEWYIVAVVTDEYGVSVIPEWEWSGMIPGTSVRAQVNKLGGGRVKRTYEGRWEVRLTAPDSDVDKAMDAYLDNTNIPLHATHAQVARFAFEWFALPETD
jgi:hypothetical protein